MRRIGQVIAALAALYSIPAVAQPAPDGLPGCTYNATPPTLSDKQTVTWQCDVNGKLITSGSAPSGAAGGDLTGTYPNPTLAWISRTAAQTLAIGAGGTLGSNAFTSTAYLPLAGGTLTGALLFTDNSFDIGAAGATRPRAGYFGTSVTIGAGSAITSSGPGGALASGAYATAVTAANPTATATGSAINGAASTFMRSDAAPAISATTVGGVTCTPGASCLPAVTSLIITGTRDLTAITGSVSYTGLGFTPSSCHVQAVVNASTTYTSWGYSDSAKTGRDIYVTNATYSAQNHFIDLLDVTGANSQVASVSSYDANGLTLAWVKTGSPTGTAQLAFLCYK